MVTKLVTEDLEKYYREFLYWHNYVNKAEKLIIHNQNLYPVIAYKKLYNLIFGSGINNYIQKIHSFYWSSSSTANYGIIYLDWKKFFDREVIEIKKRLESLKKTKNGNTERT